MKHTSLPIIAAACAALLSQTASAYVGPGAGLSLLGALWGLLLAIGAALAFIILWPVRRYFKRRAAARAAGPSAAAGAAATEDAQAARRHELPPG